MMCAPKIQMDKIINCTAWDCIGKFSHLIDYTHLIRIKGGNVLYEGAYPVLGGSKNSVKIQRFDRGANYLKVNTRYVCGDIRVELIPISKGMLTQKGELTCY